MALRLGASGVILFSYDALTRRPTPWDRSPNWAAPRSAPDPNPE